MTGRRTPSHPRRAIGRRAAVLVALAVAALATFTAPSAAQGDTGDGAVAKKTVSREVREADGTVTTLDSRTVTATVDRTTNLRGRERVVVSWSGARPSGGRTPSPYGIDGYKQEYPVVIMQCRGIDDPTLPSDEQLQPETCWTTTEIQRRSSVSRTDAVWLHDLYATPEERVDQGAGEGVDPSCYLPPAVLTQHYLPFVGADGTVYEMCSVETRAPEAAVGDNALPAAEMTGFTGIDGTGSVKFEIRTDVENESLGCSADVPCSLVVIPIMGISCMDGDAACNADGRFEPGSLNTDPSGTDGQVDPAVSPAYWWTASNWRNRITIPLDFALPPDVCDILDDRAPVDMYGSELLAQASLQWAPAYCLRDDRFKFRHNRQIESASLRLLTTGTAAAAFVSEPADPLTVTEPLGYAPTAVTGFGIAYSIDLPGNAGEVTDLKVTPRLLAKLLTESYGSVPDVRTGHPGLAGNPLNLTYDPEFQELNPGIAKTDELAAAVLLALSQPSDVTYALTSYIAADPEAMAFIAGEEDPWGMTVNPDYTGLELPVEEWPLLDTYVRPNENSACWKSVSTPWLQLMAAPVSTMRTVSNALLDAWPYTQSKCNLDPTYSPPKVSIGRGSERQPYGNRFMIGLTSLGDAERYALDTAELRTAGTGTSAQFVGASASSLSAALAATSQDETGAPFLVDYDALSATAYPGTMIVHTAALLSGLPATSAADVAQFIETATTEGQIEGSGNGELPAGFLPITDAGPTADLYGSAQIVAEAILAQKGAIATPAPTPTPTPPVAVTPTPAGSVVPLAVGPPAPGLPTSASDVGVDPVTGLPADEVPVVAPVATARTSAERSAAANNALPITMGVGLAGLVASPMLRLWATRRRVP